MSFRFAVVILAVWLLGCTSKPEPRVERPQRAATGPELDPGDNELARDLEAAMLENYLQLSLGNTEAFADSIARDRDIVLIGVGPDDLVTGTNPPERTRDFRLFADRPHCVLSISGGQPCIRMLPKILDLHLYRDDSVGWIADEISYRVPEGGREAAIPLRMTAVWIRDIDRWVLVMQHVSYPLPLADIWELARRGELARPASMRSFFDDRGRARLLKRLMTDRLGADDKHRQKHLQQMERKYQRAARNAETGAAQADVIDENALITFYPGIRNEFHGPAVHGAPSLVQLFGKNARLTLGEYRLTVAANKRVAWMAALLTVVAPDPQNGKELAIPLRATAVFAFDSYGWNIVQTHVSVAVTESQINDRVFGKALIDDL